MTNIEIQVTGAQAEGRLEGLLTAGMVGVPVTFTFDGSWENMEKTAVFRAGGETVILPLEADTVTLPWEVTGKAGCTLYVGVYGLMADGSRAVPTVWVQLGTILPGADPAGTPAAEPSLPIWKQAMDTARLALELVRLVCDRADSGDFDGYSPVRGVDYWTQADVNAIHGFVEEAILGGAW